MQRVKVDWLGKGDNNNSFLFETIKTRKNNKSMKMIQTSDGTFVHNQADIAKEVIRFYVELIGRTYIQLSHIDIEAVRDGKKLNMEQRKELVKNVTDQEIDNALKDICDLKFPDIDGFGPKFFKAFWHIVKHDVRAVVREFFETNMIFQVFQLYRCYSDFKK